MRTGIHASLLVAMDGCGSSAGLGEHTVRVFFVLCSTLIEYRYLDLLIRNSQVAAISADLISRGNWEEVSFVPAFEEDYLQLSPRLFNRTDGTFSVKIWSEEAAHLIVDPPADGRVHNLPFLIETPCCEALNPVLLESDMHPGPEISPHKPSLLTTLNIRFLPHISCQSASRQPQSKVYIPTISRYLEALIAQYQWLKENGQRVYDRRSGPGVDVSYLIRFLFLEKPSQREKILPLMKCESRSRMEEILDQYKRTDKNRFLFRWTEEGNGCDRKIMVFDKKTSAWYSSIPSPLKDDLPPRNPSLPI